MFLKPETRQATYQKEHIPDSNHCMRVLGILKHIRKNRNKPRCHEEAWIDVLDLRFIRFLQEHVTGQITLK